MHLHLILLANRKVDQITYIQCAQQTSHPVMSPERQEIFQLEPDEIKNYTVPEANIHDVKPNPDVFVLKNELDEIQKLSRPCVICFYKVSKPKSPEEHYLVLLQLYMPWRNENELKLHNQSYGDRYKEVEGDIFCSIKKHEPYLDIDYEELQNFDFVQSDGEEDNAEFSMIIPNFRDLDLEDSDM